MNKLDVEAFFSLLQTALLVTALLGIAVKRARSELSTASVSLHRTAAYFSLVLYLMSIAATEWMVRTHGGEKGSPFFPFHLFFACVSLLSFLGALWFNGERKREWHRPLVYICVTSYVIAFALALPLLELF